MTPILSHTHVAEGHALEQSSDILLIAAQAIDRLCEHDEELAAHRIADQLLKAGTQQRRAGDRAVGIAVDDCPALLFGMEAAEPQLIPRSRRLADCQSSSGRRARPS